MVGWYGAIVLCLAPVGGILIDRLGSRRSLIVFYLVEATVVGSLAFVDSFVSTLLAVSGIALGSSAIRAGQATLLTSVTDGGQRQRVFGLEFALLNLGLGLGGLIAGMIVDTSRLVTFQAVYLLATLT